MLALAFFDFVSTEVFLCLGVRRVRASNWIVLAQNKLVWGILGVFDRIVRTVTRQVTDEAN